MIPGAGGESRRTAPERAAWLPEMQREIERAYDDLWAAEYGTRWGMYANGTHLDFIRSMLRRIRTPSLVLDAPCGAGRYLPALCAAGHLVYGIDQSRRMLGRAASLNLGATLEKMTLQDMHFDVQFDAALCVDSMEHVFPELWPVILGRFHGVLKPSGFFYVSIELAEKERVCTAFRDGIAAGLPLVEGEMLDGDVYHYYPDLDDVRALLREAGFVTLEEAAGDGYHHFLLQKHGR